MGLRPGFAVVKKPAAIKVIGRRYRVEFVRTGGALQEDERGECDTDGQLISVLEGQPLEGEQDTVLHEVIHAIEHAMGLDLKEEEVEKLTTGLIAVIKDNPSFLRYLAAR